MKTWRLWQRILLGIVLLLLLAAGVIFWPDGVWPFVPRLGHLADAGAPYDAEILRDTYGVPHIFGKTDADAAYGLAYAHAEDDFLTIQQALLAARGRLATVYGRSAAPNDYMVQLFRIWEVIDARYETDLQPETRALVDAYAAGLNQYAALHPNEVVTAAMFPVTGKDVVAGFVHKTPLFYGVDGLLGEMFEPERRRPVSQKEAAATFDWPPNAPPARTNDAPLAALIANLRAPLLPLGDLSESPFPVSTRFGSNTLAVAPERTAAGDTFLAVNSHQPWSGPVAWYEAHVHSEQGWDAAGGLFPGAPLILHGHNRDLGWAFTVNSPDLADIFVLEINPDNPDQYRFDGAWRDLEVGQAPITVKLFGRFRWTVRQEVLWSVYGPTVRQPHGTYALRFAGYGEVDLVEQWYQMNRATTFAEWQTAMRDGSLPSFNVGYADKTGTIYYLYNALLPLRAEGYDWEQYLPGNTSETLWTDYLPFEQLPQVLNPAAGFIQNGNSTPFQTTLGPDNPDPADFSATFGIEPEMTNRALRALALLGRDEAITAAAFTAIKYDGGYAPESDVATFVAALLAAPPPDDPDLQAALALLRDWDLQTHPESEGATLGMLLLYFLNEMDAGLTSWKLVGNEVATDTLLAALEQAVAHLNAHFGQVTVPWGEVNRLRRGDVDAALGGGPDALHAIYGSFDEDGRLYAFSGDSHIMLVTWNAAGEVRSHSIHQFGSATLDETSPHYADQAPLFARRELKPMWLDEAEIRANLSRAYRPGEE